MGHGMCAGCVIRSGNGSKCKYRKIFNKSQNVGTAKHFWHFRVRIATIRTLTSRLTKLITAEASWNVMAHAQKPRFRLSAKRTSPFKSAGGRQFSRLLAAEVCASAVVMLDTPCSEVVWRVLATHSIRQFPCGNSCSGQQTCPTRFCSTSR